MTPRLHQPGNAVILRRSEAGSLDRRSGSIREHARRRLAGEGRLPDALCPRKEPGVVKSAPLPGGSELFDRAILPDDHGSRSAMASMRR